MEITALKSGGFAHPDPGKPQIRLKEGETYSVGSEMAASLIDCGWGEIPEEKPSLSRMTKVELEAYAKSKGFDVDTDNKKADIIAEIEDALAHG